MSIAFIKWNRNGLCGAACAHMALRALNPIAFGPTIAAQDSIWKSIKDHTHGRSKGQCCVEMPEEFDVKGDVCPGDTCAKCWWSYPTALRAALIANLPKGTTVTVRKPPDEDAANDIIRSCLARGGVPIVLVDSGLHWVVVANWNATTQKIRLFDPANPGPTTIKVAKWNVERMLTVECGTYDNKHVVVEVG
jgi:hypothetical protein